MEFGSFLSDFFRRPNIAFGKVKGRDPEVFRAHMANINPNGFRHAPKDRSVRNPKGREAARQLHFDNVRKQQAEGMETRAARMKRRNGK